ncbi:MAG: homoserine O-succinyltransferase [Lachnospiraceae bacterium]
MPICVNDDLPAKEILETENIFVMTKSRASTQDIRPLRIVILNLMPLKQDTELHLLRSLSNTPLQVDVTFLKTETYEAKNTSASHMEKFYTTFPAIQDKKYDGMIITGAPVEQLPFEEVAYWNELTQIMAWSRTNVTSTLHLCWGAQAGLYFHHGIKKYDLPQKMFGVYKHNTMHKKTPLVRGFDDTFLAPHSRHTGIKRSDVLETGELTILADSKMAGPHIIIDNQDKNIFVLGHPEYDTLTLDSEYRRDLDKGLDIQVPYNYYPDDDPDNAPVKSWRCHANTLYSNWLNYYVYQQTPYDWSPNA